MNDFIDIMADCFFTEYEENIAYDKAEKAIADHDKQIRDKVIEEFIKQCKSKRYKPSKYTGINVVDYADIDEIGRKMKGRDNE